MSDKAVIFAAFVKAQRNFAPALKASINPHFKSRYVDLSGCVEAVIDALHEQGLALIQYTSESGDGVTVETAFIHESGEIMTCGKLHVPASKHDAQGYGSALTYARRYSLMAACGIAPEDDDGNAATKAPKNGHAPVTASLHGVNIDVEQQAYLKGLAADLVDLVESQKKPTDAFQMIEKAMLDADDKLFLWGVLQPNSKTRSALKAEGAAHQKVLKSLSN